MRFRSLLDDAPLRWLAVSIVSLVASSALAGSEGSLQVGTCQRDITPITPSLAAAYQAKFGAAGVVNHSDPVYVAGFGNDRQATGYNDRLWARGVVLQRKDERVAIVSLDLVGYFKNEIDTARALVSPASEIDFVVVSSTHQHEGPDTLGIWGPDETTTGIDYAYLDFVNAEIAGCIDDAAASLEPGRVYYATGNSAGLSLGLDPEDDGFGTADSRVLAGDEALAPATQGRIIDPNMTLMQLTRREGSALDVLATIVNFASHPESLGSNNTLITSDFPHYVRERIEAEYGGVAIWLAADLGVLQGPLRIDVLDPDTGLPAPRRTFRFAEVHGTQLAERAIETVDAVRLHPGSGAPSPKNGDPSPKIRYASVDPVAIRMDNPFFRFFFAIGVLDVRRTFYTDGVPDDSVGFPYPPPFDVIPQALGEDIQTEVSVLRVGDGQMAVVPTEIDPQIANQYRAALEDEGAKHTFIVGLGNDEIGYQVPFAKFDDSCQVCAPFILAGVPESCPRYPDIDCDTIFQNNVGRQVDPKVTNAIHQAIDDL